MVLCGFWGGRVVVNQEAKRGFIFLAVLSAHAVRRAGILGWPRLGWWLRGDGWSHHAAPGRKTEGIRGRGETRLSADDVRAQGRKTEVKLDVQGEREEQGRCAYSRIKKEVMVG